jgi:hypothetical protein
MHPYLNEEEIDSVIKLISANIKVEIENRENKS